MKEEVNQRLIHYSKIGQYIVIALCWLMALVGVTAYSIYWIRQNANYTSEVIYDYEKEVYKKKTPLKARSTFNNEIYSYYQIKPYDTGYLSTSLYYNGNELNYKDYFSFISHPSSDGDSYFTYNVQGDFQAYLNGSYTYINNLVFRFYHQPSLSRATLVEVFTSKGGNYTYFYNSDFPNGSGYNINNTIIAISNLSVSSSGGITEVYLGGVLDFYFNKLYDLTDTQSIRINSGISNATNFLISYNRMPYSQAVYQVGYNLQLGYKLTINMDFVSNGQLFDAIVVIPQYCYGYIDSNGVKVENYGQGYGINQMPFITSFICYQYKGQTLSVTKTPNENSDLNTYSYDTLSDFSGGVVAGQMEIVDYIKVEKTTRLYYLYPVFDLGKGIQMNDIYSVITYKNSLLDSKVSYTFASGGTRPFSFPIDDMNYDMLFTYFNYNGPVDYVIDVNAEIGLDKSFELISSAFTGLTSLLTIQVLPGLSLGLLFFMPFLVGLIIVIIRLVKK